MTIRGCEVSYNKLLNSLVFTCSPSGRLEGRREAQSLIESSLAIISNLLGVKLRSIGVEELRMLVSSFKLFKSGIADEVELVGDVRVSGFCQNPLVVAGVIDRPEFVERLFESVKRTLVKGVHLREGEVIGPIMLSKPSSQSYPQIWVPRPAIYYIEGYPSEQQVADWRFIIENREGVREVAISNLEPLAREADLELHCVEGHSSKISLNVIDLKQVLGDVEDSSWVYVVSDKNYSSIIPGAVAKEGFIAYKREGGKITPPRVVFPQIFAWKWVKRVKVIRVMSDYLDGYWEARGYHERGLVDYDERFKIRNPDAVSDGGLICRS